MKQAIKTHADREQTNLRFHAIHDLLERQILAGVAGGNILQLNATPVTQVVTSTLPGTNRSRSYALCARKPV